MMHPKLQITWMVCEVGNFLSRIKIYASWIWSFSHPFFHLICPFSVCSPALSSVATQMGTSVRPPPSPFVNVQLHTQQKLSFGILLFPPQRNLLRFQDEIVFLIIFGIFLQIYVYPCAWSHPIIRILQNKTKQNKMNCD